LQEYQEQFDIWINQPEQEKKYQVTIMETGEKALSNHLFLRWIYPEGLTDVRLFVFYTGINISGHGTCAFPHRIQKEIL